MRIFGYLKNSIGKLITFIKSHKIISLIVLVIAISLGYFLIPKQTNNILTQKVTRKDVTKVVSVTGNIDAYTTANLSFQSPEILSYIGVKLGDVVKKGQEIAALDQTQLQASLRQTQQDFVAAKAASQQYYDNHTSGGTESDSDKVTRTAIDAAQNKAYDQMLKVENDIRNSVLYSPINGVVTRMDAQTAGVNITPLTVFTITDPSSLNFKMEVDESDIGQVKVGQDVNVSLDSFPNNILHLKVNKIDFVSHTSSSGGNAFYVNADLTNLSEYRVGMGGNADVIIDTRNNVLAISTSSIFDDNYVYLKKDNKFEKTKVSLGLQSDTDAEILSGLSEGDIVALDPTSVPQSDIIKN